MTGENYWAQTRDLSTESLEHVLKHYGKHRNFFQEYLLNLKRIPGVSGFELWPTPSTISYSCDGKSTRGGGKLPLLQIPSPELWHVPEERGYIISHSSNSIFADSLFQPRAAERSKVFFLHPAVGWKLHLTCDRLKILTPV
jgi:hypothetical protein